MEQGLQGHTAWGDTWLSSNQPHLEPNGASVSPPVKWGGKVSKPWTWGDSGGTVALPRLPFKVLSLKWQAWEPGGWGCREVGGGLGSSTQARLGVAVKAVVTAMAPSPATSIAALGSGPTVLCLSACLSVCGRGRVGPEDRERTGALSPRRHRRWASGHGGRMPGWRPWPLTGVIYEALGKAEPLWPLPSLSGPLSLSPSPPGVGSTKQGAQPGSTCHAPHSGLGLGGGGHGRGGDREGGQPAGPLRLGPGRCPGPVGDTHVMGPQDWGAGQPEQRWSHSVPLVPATAS
jgi:hypothetical protein